MNNPPLNFNGFNLSALQFPQGATLAGAGLGQAPGQLGGQLGAQLGGQLGGQLAHLQVPLGGPGGGGGLPGLQPIGEKKCSICQQYKPYAQYSKDKTSRDGLESRCKGCRAQKNLERKQKNSQNGVLAVEKKCTCCGIVKPAEMFKRHIHGAGGLDSWCKECHRRKRDKKAGIDSGPTNYRGGYGGYNNNNQGNNNLVFLSNAQPGNLINSQLLLNTQGGNGLGGLNLQQLANLGNIPGLGQNLLASIQNGQGLPQINIQTLGNLGNGLQLNNQGLQLNPSSLLGGGQQIQIQIAGQQQPQNNNQVIQIPGPNGQMITLPGMPTGANSGNVDMNKPLGNNTGGDDNTSDGSKNAAGLQQTANLQILPLSTNQQGQQGQQQQQQPGSPNSQAAQNGQNGQNPVAMYQSGDGKVIIIQLQGNGAPVAGAPGIQLTPGGNAGQIIGNLGGANDQQQQQQGVGDLNLNGFNLSAVLQNTANIMDGQNQNNGGDSNNINLANLNNINLAGLPLEQQIANIVANAQQGMVQSTIGSLTPQNNAQMLLPGNMQQGNNQQNNVLNIQGLQGQAIFIPGMGGDQQQQQNQDGNNVIQTADGSTVMVGQGQVNAAGQMMQGADGQNVQPGTVTVYNTSLPGGITIIPDALGNINLGNLVVAPNTDVNSLLQTGAFRSNSQGGGATDPNEQAAAAVAAAANPMQGSEGTSEDAAMQARALSMSSTLEHVPIIGLGGNVQIAGLQGNIALPVNLGQQTGDDMPGTAGAADATGGDITAALAGASEAMAAATPDLNAQQAQQAGTDGTTDMSGVDHGGSDVITAEQLQQAAEEQQKQQEQALAEATAAAMAAAAATAEPPAAPAADVAPAMMVKVEDMTPQPAQLQPVVETQVVAPAPVAALPAQDMAAQIAAAAAVTPGMQNVPVSSYMQSMAHQPFPAMVPVDMGPRVSDDSAKLGAMGSVGTDDGEHGHPSQNRRTSSRRHVVSRKAAEAAEIDQIDFEDETHRAAKRMRRLPGMSPQHDMSGQGLPTPGGMVGDMAHLQAAVPGVEVKSEEQQPQQQAPQHATPIPGGPGMVPTS